MNTTLICVVALSHSATTAGCYIILIDLNIFLAKANNISVGLFASKEQELEQRAMLIKRLSFTLFCSEKDQHQKYLQQIQGNVIQNVFQEIHSWFENGMLQHSFVGSVIFLLLQHFIILKFIRLHN